MKTLGAVTIVLLLSSCSGKNTGGLLASEAPSSHQVFLNLMHDFTPIWTDYQDDLWGQQVCVDLDAKENPLGQPPGDEAQRQIVIQATRTATDAFCPRSRGVLDKYVSKFR
ncbi:hypothetical protein ACSMXN_14480 [Jatrophihabitans sp. DSM 45814]